MPAIRAAIDYPSPTMVPVRPPLLEREMLKDGVDLFIKEYERLVKTSEHSQMEMRQIMAGPGT